MGKINVFNKEYKWDINDMIEHENAKRQQAEQEALSILVGPSATVAEHIENMEERLIRRLYSEAKSNVVRKYMEEQIKRSFEQIDEASLDDVENPVHQSLLRMIHARTQRKSHKKWFVTFNPENEVNDKIIKRFDKICSDNPGSKWVLEYRDEETKTGEHIHAKLVFKTDVAWSKVREKFKSLMEFCTHDQHLNVKPIYNDEYEQNIDAYMVKQKHNQILDQI